MALYNSFRWLFLLVLFVACGYYILLFYGKLSDVNMFTAVSWAFRSKAAVGRNFKVFVFPIMATFFYMIFIICFFVFLETPIQVLKLKGHNAGGLLGYRDGLTAMVYDISNNDYVAYRHWNPPRAAGSFKDAFETVMFYKDRPYSKKYSEYYRDTMTMSIPGVVITLVVMALMLFVVYFLLYALADAYISKNRLGIELSHHIISSRFLEAAGVTPLKAVLIALAVYAVVAGGGVVSVRKILGHYNERYAPYQREMRAGLMNKVSPGRSLTGTVVKRDHVSMSRKDQRTGKYKQYSVAVFTAEFRDLVHVPVYLDVNVDTSSLMNAGEVKERLEGLFPDDRDATDPKETPALEFIVNPDYSVSLK